jgi:cell division septal protein FtsQ
MSQRKSWDIQPQRKAAAKPAQAPVRSAPAARPAKKRAAPARPTRNRAPLKERRRQRRRTARYVVLAVILLVLTGAEYALWLPSLRITTVEADGPAAESVKSITLKNLSGVYWHIAPRNSVFLYPDNQVRSAILAQHPEIAAVSLSRTSFSSLSVHTTPRAESFAWCGTSIDDPIADGSCYQADIEGLIFKQIPPEPSAGTSTEPLPQGDVRVFSPVDRDVSEGKSPIGAHMHSAERIPDALKFVAAMRDLGAPVSALVIRGDEADLWLNGATRITYVLGQEMEAASVAASALPTLTLTDGSIKYVDLRFPGKAYIGRYGE